MSNDNNDSNEYLIIEQKNPSGSESTFNPENKKNEKILTLLEIFIKEFEQFKFSFNGDQVENLFISQNKEYTVNNCYTEYAKFFRNQMTKHNLLKYLQVLLKTKKANNTQNLQFKLNEKCILYVICVCYPIGDIRDQLFIELQDQDVLEVDLFKQIQGLLLC